MGIPGITYVNLVGTYIDINANPIAGQLVFQAVDGVTGNAIYLTATTPSEMVMPSTIIGRLSSGAFSVELPATDSPNMSPTGFLWAVTEQINGGRSYKVNLTSAQSPGPVNLDTLTPASTTNGPVYLNGVSTFNGRFGAVVAISGDYTAAQVTNAADKSSASQQTFTGSVQMPSLGIGTAPSGTAGDLDLSGNVGLLSNTAITWASAGAIKSITSDNTYISAPTGGGIFFRPAGIGSGTNQSWFDTNGNLSVAGILTVNGDFVVGNGAIGLTPAGGNDHLFYVSTSGVGIYNASGVQSWLFPAAGPAAFTSGDLFLVWNATTKTVEVSTLGPAT